MSLDKTSFLPSPRLALPLAVAKRIVVDLEQSMITISWLVLPMRIRVAGQNGQISIVEDVSIEHVARPAVAMRTILQSMIPRVADVSWSRMESAEKVKATVKLIQL